MGVVSNPRAEPWRLKRWRLPSLQGTHAFYTCARPGRSLGKQADVPDAVVLEWARGLPGDADVIVVSLLGQKPNGTKEYSFYSFFAHGQTLQDWLSDQNIERTIHIVEHPTTDSKPIPRQVQLSVADDILRFLSGGRTVVLMDSGGVQRTGAVCCHLGGVPISGVHI
jgi:hypothetical protein